MRGVLLRRYMNPVDVHNKLRQGERSMADAWGTHSWQTRHFSEMLGFTEVNIFKSLQYFKKGRWASMNHNSFRRRLAHAFLTLGKEPFPDDLLADGSGAASTTSSAFRSPPSGVSLSSLSAVSASGLFNGPSGFEHTFVLYKEGASARELHRCGYCGCRTAKYCKTCYDIGRGKIAVCGRKSGRNCIDEHAAGSQLKHSSHNLAVKKKVQDDEQHPCDDSQPRRSKRRRAHDARDDE